MNATEAVIQRDSALLRLAEASYPIGVWNWSAGDAGIYWSDALFRMFGIDATAGELMSLERFVSLVHPEDRYLFADWRRVMTESWLVGQTCRAVLADGSTRIVHIRGEAVWAADKLLQAYGVIADITANADHGPAEVSEISNAQIRAARAWLDWSAQDLAEHSGVSFSTVRRIEAPGPRAVRGANVNAIRRAFAQHGIRFVVYPDGSSGVISR
jgi:DNA-binding transcriptional regulator YiaG